MESRDFELSFDEWVELKHEPEAPPRPDVYGEGIFLDAWQRMMAETPEFGDGELNEMFCTVFSEISGPATQRQATVAATFVAWLGCNWGKCYILGAQDRCKGLARDLWPQAYLSEWTWQNKRVACVNSGRRTIEAMLESPTIHDLEIADHLAVFLGSNRGQRFISDAEAEIKETQVSLRAVNSMKGRAMVRAANLVRSGRGGFL